MTRRMSTVIDVDPSRYFDTIRHSATKLIWTGMLSMDNVSEVELSVFFPGRQDPAEMTIKIRDLALQTSFRRSVS